MPGSPPQGTEDVPCEVVLGSLREPSDFAGLPVVTDAGVSLHAPAWGPSRGRAQQGGRAAGRADDGGGSTAGAPTRTCLRVGGGDDRHGGGQSQVTDHAVQDHSQHRGLHRRRESRCEMADRSAPVPCRASRSRSSYLMMYATRIAWVGSVSRQPFHIFENALGDSRSGGQQPSCGRPMVDLAPAAPSCGLGCVVTADLGDHGVGELDEVEVVGRPGPRPATPAGQPLAYAADGSIATWVIEALQSSPRFVEPGHHVDGAAAQGLPEQPLLTGQVDEPGCQRSVRTHRPTRRTSTAGSDCPRGGLRHRVKRSTKAPDSAVRGLGWCHLSAVRRFRPQAARRRCHAAAGPGSTPLPPARRRS